ncbi:MAG: sulfatase [Gimesia sp.]|nr:sulfatase [Gimesia sp.]
MMYSLRTLTVTLLMFCWPAVNASAADRPNILMIMVDDLRPMLGCYGDPRAKTPNIDRLASRGVVFERAYCQYAKCGPSRLSMMTGLRPDSIGVFNHRNDSATKFRDRQPAIVSMARWLKDQGYHTRGLGKIYHDGWDLSSDWSEPSFPGRNKEMLEIFDQKHPDGPSIIADRFACPVMQGPDVPDNHFFAGRMTDEAIRIIHKQDREKPMFLAVGYRRPHLPFVAPRRYYDLHQPDHSWLAKNPNPPHNSPVMAWFNSDGYVGAARRAKLKMPIPPSLAEGPLWNGYEMRSYLGAPNYGVIDQRLQLNLLHAYAACVSYVDTQIGKLLDGLEKTNRSSNTIIVLCSDHGWHLGEQSAWSKMTNFEIATRVPLIIVAPGIKSSRTRNLAELVDLYPTLCELTGVKKPPHLAGESLVPTLQQPEQQTESTALSQHTRFGEKFMGRALRTDRHRFVVWFEKKSGRIVERELYDHQTDPLETSNIAGDPDQADRILILEAQLRMSFGLR